MSSFVGECSMFMYFLFPTYPHCVHFFFARKPPNKEGVRTDKCFNYGAVEYIFAETERVFLQQVPYE